MFFKLFHPSVISTALWVLKTVAATGSPHGITSDASMFSQQEFDILIAGGGTAGITLAARLSEGTSLQIGVIEAGELIIPGQNPLVDTPGLTGQSFTDPTLSWGFNTIPQDNLGNRIVSYPRGKMIGGSSGLNSMAWVRPRKDDLDNWSNFGVQGGWNWDGLLPYMIKSENVSIGSSTAFPGSTQPSGVDSSVNGRKGPIQVSYDPTFTGVQTPVVQSFLNIGAVLNQVPEGGNNIGVFNSQHSVDIATGNRSYAATAYFIPNQGRQNLLVLTGARVGTSAPEPSMELKADGNYQISKILFSSNSIPLTATGLEYIQGNVTYTATAAREVLLTAGAIQTPQLLELSGIGNSSLLGSLGIPTLLDIPTVGENLQDHNSVSTTYLLKEPSPITLDDLTNNASFAMEQQLFYLENHTGLFTLVPTYSYHPLQSFFSPAEIACLINETAKELNERTLSTFHRLQANLQIAMLKEGEIGQIEIAPFGGGIPGLQNPLVPGRSYVSLVGFSQHLFSRGSVHIGTNSPLDPPIIDPNFMDFEFDRSILSLSVQLSARIAAAPPLSNLIESRLNPSPNITGGQALNDYIDTNLAPEFNALGTAALASEELGGVVGDDLFVYGTRNLRIVDASIFPMHLATHIQTLVYAVAEKAADMIIASL